VTGPPLQRLLASLLIGFVLVGAYWLAMESIPRAMLAEADAAEADAAAKIVVVGAR
jgi:hypothetical protein